jgi:hypothetical protein
MIRGIENVIYSSFAFISIPNRLKVFISSHEIRIPYISQIPDMSDISQVFRFADNLRIWKDILEDRIRCIDEQEQICPLYRICLS